MFALALWDKFKKKLILARDRIGEKPLYWGWAGKHFIFGSELKALHYTDCSNEINKSLLCSILDIHIFLLHTAYIRIYLNLTVLSFL